MRPFLTKFHTESNAPIGILVKVRGADKSGRANKREIRTLIWTLRRYARGKNVPTEV